MSQVFNEEEIEAKAREYEEALRAGIRDGESLRQTP